MKKPQRLRPKDKVAIVSLSSGMMGEEAFLHKYTLAKQRLEQDYGLEVVTMPNALKGQAYLYQHPEARAADWMQAFADPEIKAIFNAIGGDDAIRLLPYIDDKIIAQNPKIFTGFSDTTVNHFMMYQAGIVSYYGLSVMNQLAEYVEINPYTRKAIDTMLMHPQAPYTIPASPFASYETDRIDWANENQHLSTPRYPNEGYVVVQGHGKVTGELLGGCVDVFVSLMGTPLWPTLDQWKGKLLLMETSEMDMPLYLFAEILRNLEAQGILDVIAGIVFGKPAFKKKIEPYHQVLRQILQVENAHQDLVVLGNVNIGHAYPTGILALGLPYEIDCEQKNIQAPGRKLSMTVFFSLLLVRYLNGSVKKAMKKTKDSYLEFHSRF